MKLYNRISSGLFYPRQLANYTNDNRLFTFFYYLLLVVLLTIPYIAIYSTIDLFDYQSKEAIRKSVVISDDIPFYIADNQLFHDSDDDTYVYNTTITNVIDLYITVNNDFTPEINDPLNSLTSLIIQNDGVYTAVSSVKVKVLDYSEFESLEGLDFTDANDARSTFWPTIFSVIEAKIKMMEIPVRVYMILTALLSSAINIMLITLMITVFQRFYYVGRVKFSRLWQVMIYAATPYVLGSLLADLFGFILIYYVGFIVMIVNSILISREITMRGGQNEL